MQTLGFLEYPWEIVGIEYVTDLRKSGTYSYRTVLIMVCHRTKMAHFIPCHKEITAVESADLFICNCYKLHRVSEILVSDKNPMFCWKVLAKLYEKIKH